MEKFLSLPEEKQKKIIDAALKAFGANGYKKTSISDIAAAAGISKAMVFHYFGTKKDLYFYLVQYCGNLIMNEVNEKFDTTITDFFERIKLSSEIELSVMRKHTAIPAFLTNIYFETDDEVKGYLQNMLAESEGFRNSIAFDGMDASKFKDGIDIKLVMKMLYWLADGFTNQFKNKPDVDFDAYCQEFYECMDLLKNNFYKEEYVRK